MVHRRALGGCVALVACSILIGCAREPVPVATPRDLTEQRLLTPDPTILVPNLAEIARLQPASAAASPEEITPPPEQSATEAERYRLRPGDLVEVLYRFPAAATAEPYRIGVGDQVRVDFVQTPEYDQTARVRPDGRISLPLVGDVEAAGRTPDALRASLRERFADFLSEPELSVQILDAGGPAESLRASIAGALNGQSRLCRVRPDGYLSLPVLGDVAAAGGTLDALRPEIEAAYRVRGLGAVEVSLALAEPPATEAYVLGEVAAPGPVALEGPIDLWRLIGRAGGFGPRADRRHVLVSRSAGDGEERYLLDFDAWRFGIAPQENLAIEPGDLVYVRPAGGDHLWVLGDVPRPGRIALESTEPLSLAQALGLAGLAPESRRQILVLRTRVDAGSIASSGSGRLQPLIFVVTDTAAERPYGIDPSLQPEDIVFVPERPIEDLQGFAGQWFRDGRWQLMPWWRAMDGPAATSGIE